MKLIVIVIRMIMKILMMMRKMRMMLMMMVMLMLMRLNTKKCLLHKEEDESDITAASFIKSCMTELKQSIVHTATKLHLAARNTSPQRLVHKLRHHVQDKYHQGCLLELLHSKF